MNIPSRGQGVRAPTLAAALGVLALLIVLAAIPLEVVNPGTFSVRGSDPLSDATGVVFVLAFGAMGTLVARRQPTNPIGWLLLAATIAWELGNYIPSYLIVDYRVHHGSLPLGHVAMVLDSSFLYGLLLVPLVILMFPDGRLGRRWRRPLYAYAGVCLADVVATVSLAVSDFGLRMPIDSGDSLVNSNHPRGAEAWSGSVQALGLLALFALSIAAVVHQVRNYRRASGERRAQLRWLGSAAALCALLLPTFIWSDAPGAVGDALALGLTAVPVAIAMGVLRYRLYEIDRIVSRTLAYAILTALLVGTFIGLVALGTDTLALSGRVGVAASTLAAAALFNPLRVRIQRLVDRRFNRARYDAEATVAAFTARLRDAVEIEAIRADLLDAVQGAVQPSHASIWIRECPLGARAHRS